VALSEISCEEVLSEIEHYLHGELDQVKSAYLTEHLADCPPCFERAEFRRRLKEIVRAKCRSEAPEHLVWRVRMAIRTTRFPDREGPPGTL
jgi:mycothiol system anti-sigma-R factor